MSVFVSTVYHFINVLYMCAGLIQILQAGVSKRNCTSDAQNYSFKALQVTRPRDYVVQVELNRPEKRNAMNTDFWRCG